MIEFNTGRVILHENAITLELDPATVTELKTYVRNNEFQAAIKVVVYPEPQPVVSYPEMGTGEIKRHFSITD